MSETEEKDDARLAKTAVNRESGSTAARNEPVPPTAPERLGREDLRAELLMLVDKWNAASDFSYRNARKLPARSKARAIHENIGDLYLRFVEEVEAVLYPEDREA